MPNLGFLLLSETVLNIKIWKYFYNPYPYPEYAIVKKSQKSLNNLQLQWLLYS